MILGRIRELRPLKAKWSPFETEDSTRNAVQGVSWRIPTAFRLSFSFEGQKPLWWAEMEFEPKADWVYGEHYMFFQQHAAIEPTNVKRCSLDVCLYQWKEVVKDLRRGGARR